jgi:hypothetical protein
MGPKYGVARGVAVYSSDIDRSTADDGPLPDSGRLRQWCLAHDVALENDSASLETLDSHLDEWSADPSHYEHVDLGNEVGIYLGNVIVTNIVAARWRVWPNGHPVISLTSGKELDVIAMVNDRLLRSGSSLPSIYTSATSR